MLFSTHDPNHALRYARTALLVRDGRTLAQGLVNEVLQPAQLQALYAAPVLALRDARGECDIASVHLMDPATGLYNSHLLSEGAVKLPGYRRLQGIVFREGDTRFDGRSVERAVAAALGDPDCTLVNRNAGSGTRVLVDRLLG